MVIRKIWKRPRENQISILIKIKTNKRTYLIGKNKRRENFEEKKKCTKFYKNSGNNYQGQQGNNLKNDKHQNPATIKERKLPLLLIKIIHKGNP